MRTHAQILQKERSASGYLKGGGPVDFACVCMREEWGGIWGGGGVLINCTDVDFFKLNPRFTQ